MKIKNQPAQSFGIKRLYCAKLLNSKYCMKNILKDVFISELEVKDKDFMKKKLKKWRSSSCGEQIIRAFLDECKEYYPKIGRYENFFVVEAPKKNGDTQIKALCMTLSRDKDTKLIYLQSDSELCPKTALQGLGSCMMYATVKSAKKMKDKLVQLSAMPDAEAFYEKIGFKKPDNGWMDFMLVKQKFNKFLKGMEEKYSIKKYIKKNGIF